MTDRGVSPVLGYIMTLSVATLLVGSLIVATGSYVDGQRDRTAEGELQVVGQQVSADFAAADRLNRTDSPDEIALGQALPSRVVGSSYRITVRSDGDGPTDQYLELVATDLDVTVRVGLTIESDARGSADGGPVVIEYEGDGLVLSDG